jgi:kynurenine formamidase
MKKGGRELPILAALLVLAACAPAPEPEAAESSTAAPIDLANYELVDLTYAYGDDTLYWPTSPTRFELEQLSYGMTEGGFFYAANQLCTPEHGGTHLDAPIHFAAERWTTDAVPLERLVGPAVVLDVSEAAAADSDFRLSRADVESWEADHGEIPAGSIALLRTGWGQRWSEGAKAYLGDDTPGDASNLHFPSFGEDAARLLIEEREVSVLGVDAASIDYGPSTDFIVHQIASGANVPGLENVAQLERLPPTGAWVIALPMKIGGGSGGPVRIVALVPRGAPSESPAP